jgi:hypothetical protein
LLADLAHAADNDVIDARRIDPAAVDQCVEDLGPKVGGMPILQGTSTSSSSGSCCFNDIGFRHGQILLGREAENCGRLARKRSAVGMCKRDLGAGDRTCRIAAQLPDALDDCEQPVHSRVDA